MVRVALVLVSLLLCAQPAFAGGVADADAGVTRLTAGDAAAAEKLFTRAIQSKELSPQRLALTYHHRGMAFQKEGQAVRAILDYTMALWNTNLPKDVKPRTLNNRGYAFEAINDFDSALRDYSLAIRLNDTYAEAYSNRGNVYRRFNRYTEAIGDFDQALRNEHPHPKHVFVWQGLSLEGLGKRREAMDAYRRALTIDPKFALAKSHLKRLEDTQSLDGMLGTRKPAKLAGAPAALTGTPDLMGTAARAQAELQAAPWSPPAPQIVKHVAPPPEPESGLSLRPAFDDRPKHAPPPPSEPQVKPAVQVAPESAAPEKPTVREKPVVATAPSAEPQLKPASSIAPQSQLPQLSQRTGEGGSDADYALQLGSFNSEDLARAGWTKVERVVGDLLEGLRHVIQPVPMAEKGTVYRLFAEALPDRDKALGLCRTLRDKGIACIVVRR